MKKQDYNMDIRGIERMIDLAGAAQPVSRETIRLRQKRKKTLYILILKSAGVYSAISFISISLYFASRKLIAAVSLKTVISVIAAATITSGSIYVIRAYITRPAAEEQHIATVPVAEVAPAVEKMKPTVKPAEVIHYRIGMRDIESVSVDQNTRREIERSLLRAFTDARGAKFAASSRNVSDEQIDYALRASIEKADENYVLLIKLVDLRSSSIIFITKDVFPVKADASERYRSLAAKISDSLK
jgi:hypothetical protein